MMATYLITATGNELAPSLYLTLAALVSVLAIFTMTETANEPLT